MIARVSFLFFFAACCFAAEPDWTGTWRGSLTNHPARPNAKTVEVVREIGPFPAADNTCTTFKTTYLEAGEVKATKDYRLCRGTGATDLYIDEGDGVKLASKWIGDVLVSPFKYNDLLLIATTRVRGDTMEEEILTVDDKPAIKGVLALNAKGIQRLTFQRVK
jgi:hypothetical protein